jgi:hypothetical protein
MRRHISVGFGYIHVCLGFPSRLVAHASSRGYVVPKWQMIGALRWISYINVGCLAMFFGRLTECSTALEVGL